MNNPYCAACYENGSEVEMYWVTCHVCHGHGSIDDVYNCPECGGSGGWWRCPNCGREVD